MQRLTLPLQIPGDGLTLKRVAPRHTQPLWRAIHLSHEQIRPWLYDIPESPEDTRFWTETYAHKAKEGTGYAYAITSAKNKSELLGCLTIYEVYHSQRLTELTLAYWVSTAHTGKKVARRGLQALLGVTDSKGAHTLLTIGKQNIPSQKVATALGYEIVQPDADDLNFNYYRSAQRPSFASGNL